MSRFNATEFHVGQVAANLRAGWDSEVCKETNAYVLPARDRRAQKLCSNRCERLTRMVEHPGDDGSFEFG